MIKKGVSGSKQGPGCTQRSVHLWVLGSQTTSPAEVRLNKFSITRGPFTYVDVWDV